MNRRIIITAIKKGIEHGAHTQRASRNVRQTLKVARRAGLAGNYVAEHGKLDSDRAFTRRTLRDLYLALAYLRGVPYAVVERKCRTAPNPWGVVRTIWDVRGDKQALQQPLHEDIKAWLAGKAPAWPSFPGEALARYRRLQASMERADAATWEELAARADVVWYTALSDEEHKLLAGEENAADGRAA